MDDKTDKGEKMTLTIEELDEIMRPKYQKICSEFLDEQYWE